MTQGGGPLEVALNAVLITSETHPDELERAAGALSEARPTNTTMKREITGILKRYRAGEDMKTLVGEVFLRYDRAYDAMSDIGESLIRDGDGILTHCFPEHSFMLSVAKAIRNGKRIRVYVPETRPYLQGAHLTEPCLREIGVECYLITDAMNAHFMAEGRIAKVMTASDLALSDRTSPDDEIPVIEYREGEDLKHVGGCAIAAPEAKALYPCFDVISPDFVSGVVHPEGIYEGNNRWNRHR